MLIREIRYVEWGREAGNDVFDVFYFLIMFVLPEEFRPSGRTGDAIRFRVLLSKTRKKTSELDLSIMSKDEEFMFYMLSVGDIETIIHVFNWAKDIIKKYEEEDHEKK